LISATAVAVAFFVREAATAMNKVTPRRFVLCCAKVQKIAIDRVTRAA
jgi:hypothetical protein